MISLGLFFVTVLGFSQEAVPPLPSETEDFQRLSYLLANKGFLNSAASQEIQATASRLSESQKSLLYNEFRLEPLFVPYPAISHFEFFPAYENTVPKVTIGVVGGIGFFATLYAILLMPKDDIPPRAIVGLTGWATAATAEIYLLGLAIWEPQGYDPVTVNQRMKNLLNIVRDY